MGMLARCLDPAWEARFDRLRAILLGRRGGGLCLSLAVPGRWAREVKAEIDVEAERHVDILVGSSD